VRQSIFADGVTDNLPMGIRELPVLTSQTDNIKQGLTPFIVSQNSGGLKRQSFGSEANTTNV
jgi:hypothetical protein